MNPYLSFPNGDCQAAFDLYQQVFGAKCVFSHTWADSPMADQARVATAARSCTPHCSSPMARC